MYLVIIPTVYAYRLQHAVFLFRGLFNNISIYRVAGHSTQVITEQYECLKILHKKHIEVVPVNCLYKHTSDISQPEVGYLAMCPTCLRQSLDLHCAMKDPETRIANTRAGWPILSQRMITDALSANPFPTPPSPNIHNPSKHAQANYFYYCFKIRLRWLFTSASPS